MMRKGMTGPSGAHGLATTRRAGMSGGASASGPRPGAGKCAGVRGREAQGTALRGGEGPEVLLPLLHENEGPGRSLHANGTPVLKRPMNLPGFARSGTGCGRFGGMESTGRNRSTNLPRFIRKRRDRGSLRVNRTPVLNLSMKRDHFLRSGAGRGRFGGMGATVRNRPVNLPRFGGSGPGRALFDGMGVSGPDRGSGPGYATESGVMRRVPDLSLRRKRRDGGPLHRNLPSLRRALRGDPPLHVNGGATG